MSRQSQRGLIRPEAHRIHERITLDGNDLHQTASFVARLRDLHSEATDVVWYASMSADFDVTPLVHLPPPQPEGTSAAPLEYWLEAHRPAMCYFRVGPGFIEIRDTRQLPVSARFVLDEPILIDTFKVCLQPRLFAELPPRGQEAARLMLDERLLLRLDDWITTLPSRMQRWPIPSQIV